MPEEMLPAPDDILNTEVCVVDCSTGEQKQRSQTKKEVESATIEWWEGVGAAVEITEVVNQKEQVKEEILNKLSELTDTPVEQIKEALGVPESI